MELYALCYGRSRYPARLVFPERKPPGDVDFGWFFFAWQDADGWGLIDTGFEDCEAAEEFALSEHRSPSELLAELGAGAIGRIILTHGHFDHAGTCARYPEARIVMARRELEAMRAALTEHDWHQGYRRRELEALESLDVELIEASARRWGFTLEVVGGHTPGILRVEAPGLTLHSDNAYLYANLDGEPGVPGHDLEILERFPRVTDRIARLTPGGLRPGRSR